MKTTEAEIQKMIDGKNVTFIGFRDNRFWYTTECQFTFPVPLEDVGKMVMVPIATASKLERWIRERIDFIDSIPFEPWVAPAGCDRGKIC